MLNEAKYRSLAMEALQKEREAAERELARKCAPFYRMLAAFAGRIPEHLRKWTQTHHIRIKHKDQNI